MACGRWVSLSECSHSGDGGLGITGHVDDSGKETGKGSASAPSRPDSPTNPRGGTGYGEFLGYTILPAESHAEVAQRQHETRTSGMHCNPSPAQVGFGPVFRECVGVPEWVSLPDLPSWCLCAMPWRDSCLEHSSIQHPHPALTVSSFLSMGSCSGSTTGLYLPNGEQLETDDCLGYLLVAWTFCLLV